MAIESPLDFFGTISQLVKYEVWCNLQAVDFFSALLAAEHHRDFGFGLRTPHRTLFHVADVMRGWSGCAGPIIQKPSWQTYDPGVGFHNIRSVLVDTGDSWLA